MAIEKTASRESKGDDTQFECTVDGKIWIVSLHCDAALVVSEDSRYIYFNKGGEHDLGWCVRIRQEDHRDKTKHWKPVTDPALISLLDSLHFACLRKDETESAVPQSERET